MPFHELAAAGISHREIASRLHIQRQTVRKYLRLPECVDRRQGLFPSHLEPYRAYLQQRWEQGEVMIKRLWQELQQQGFTGSYSSLWKLRAHLASASRHGLQCLVRFLCASHSLDAGHAHSPPNHVAALA